MFGTTRNFLDYFGLKKLDDLPPLADLSDWESLRVQLNLPDVGEDAMESGVEASQDVPVLYPEIDTAEFEDSIDEALEGDSDFGMSDEDVEELVVSEWPDPNDPTEIASLETLPGKGDKDRSASG